MPASTAPAIAATFQPMAMDTSADPKPLLPVHSNDTGTRGPMGDIKEGSATGRDVGEALRTRRTYAQVAAATSATPATAGAEAPRVLPDCSSCGRSFQSARGLAMHKARTHPTSSITDMPTDGAVPVGATEAAGSPVDSPVTITKVTCAVCGKSLLPASMPGHLKTHVPRFTVPLPVPLDFRFQSIVSGRACFYLFLITHSHILFSSPILSSLLFSSPLSECSQKGRGQLCQGD
jgi:hypothetical protein